MGFYCDFQFGHGLAGGLCDLELGDFGKTSDDFLAGIEGNYELAPETTGNLFELAEQGNLDESIELLPSSLAEALDLMEQSELAREALGEHIFEWFLRNKRAEWAAYKAHVSQFELDRYLGNW